MNIEKQVTNLELSKKLKELGVKQESVWYWADGKIIMLETVIYKHLIRESPERLISAFTVAELGEKLPYWINVIKTEEGLWCVFENEFLEKYSDWKIKYTGISSDTSAANAYAKARIWLIENNHVTV